MIVVGIDPGLSGALAVWDTDTQALTIHDMPVFEHVVPGKKAVRRVLNEVELARLTFNVIPGEPLVWLEQVNGLPGQSGPGAFSFGQVYGAIRMAVLAAGLPLNVVQPAIWKSAMRVRRSDAPKEASRARASELLPQYAHLWARKKDADRAEAALIALYGAKSGRTA